MEDTLNLAALGANQAGVFALPPAGADATVAAARAAGLTPWRIDLKRIRTKRGLLTALARELALPEWFGHNWDALEDCLTDLEWVQTPDGGAPKGFALILEHATGLQAASPDEMDSLLAICASAADFWRGEDKAFWTLTDATAPRLSALPAAD